MKRILGIVLFLFLMMIPTDMSAWTGVDFLSDITSWTESSDSHHNMTKVNENQFTYSLDLSSYTTDLKFTFFVSDNHGRIGPNDGDGTEATLGTEVWGGQGNSGSFLLKHSTSEYSTYKIILTWENQGNDGKHYWTVKVAGETKKPIQVWLGNNLNGDEGSGWTRTSDNLFTTVNPDSEWIYTLTNPNKDFKFKIMWSYGSGTSTVNYYAPTNTYQIGDVETISSTGSDVTVGNESKYKNYTFKVTKNQDTWKLRVTVECNHGTGYTYTAYYINSTGWPEVFGYAFKDNKPVTISFPGEQCTKTTETIDGNDVWKWEIELGSADGVPDGIIFSNGYDGDVVYDDKSHNQTGNQYFINEGIYAYYAYNGDTYSTSIYKAAIPDGTTADGNKFEINHDVTAQTVELKREDFIADKWATVCLPFNITASDLSNYGDFYKIKSYANNKVTFEGPLTTDITAYTPYLFKPKNSGKLFTNLTNATVKATGTTHSHVATGTGDVNFIGVTQRTVVTPDANTLVYGFANGNYVKVTEGRIKSFRAYITVPASSNAKQTLDIDLVEEETTGINTMHNEECIMHNAPALYDLQGRKLPSLSGGVGGRPGIYIVNGRKIVIK